MTSNELLKEMDKLTFEIWNIKSMDEEEVCKSYKVNKSEEAITLILEELERLNDDYTLYADIEELDTKMKAETLRLALNNPNRKLLHNY